MLAKQKWQINTIAVLERVFAERLRQHEKHGDAMRPMPDGVGPETRWLLPYTNDSAEQIQRELRDDYEDATDDGALTRLHLVREELAEMFEADPDAPEFIDEAVQVAALLVQWVEYKLEEQDVL